MSRDVVSGPRPRSSTPSAPSSSPYQPFQGGRSSAQGVGPVLRLLNRFKPRCRSIRHSRSKTVEGNTARGRAKKAAIWAAFPKCVGILRGCGGTQLALLALRRSHFSEIRTMESWQRPYLGRTCQDWRKLQHRCPKSLINSLAGARLTPCSLPRARTGRRQSHSPPA